MGRSRNAVVGLDRSAIRSEDKELEPGVLAAGSARPSGTHVPNKSAVRRLLISASRFKQPSRLSRSPGLRDCTDDRDPRRHRWSMFHAVSPPVIHPPNRRPAAVAAPPTRTRKAGLFADNGRVDSLLLRLHAAADIPQFWHALQSLLGETTPHDALIVYLNFLDFATSWQAAQILATPNAQRPLTWFHNRRQVDMTPQFVLSQPRKIKLYRLSDVVPDFGELQQTAFFKEFLAPNGWHHLAVALYWRGAQVGSQIA